MAVVATFYNGMAPQLIEADITSRFERFDYQGSTVSVLLTVFLVPATYYLMHQREVVRAVGQPRRGFGDICAIYIYHLQRGHSLWILIQEREFSSWVAWRAALLARRACAGWTSTRKSYSSTADRTFRLPIAGCRIMSAT